MAVALSHRTPLWLDCDPGHDDAFAILLAAYHPHLRLLGVSTVHGNASRDSTTKNAYRLLIAIGRAGDIPVYPGAAKPFCRDSAIYAPDIHGETGLDGTDLLPRLPHQVSTLTKDDPSAQGSPTPCLVAIRQALLSCPKGTPWVVATGSMTNVALLFAAFPELVEHIAGLSIMGGAVGGGFAEGKTDEETGKASGLEVERRRVGNTTPWAEFNIYCDPEAAESLFSTPDLARKTTLISLDLTHQVLASESIRDRLLHGDPRAALAPSSGTAPSSSSSSPLPPAVPSPFRKLFYDLLVFFSNTYASVFGLGVGPPLHDPVAVAVVLHCMELAGGSGKQNDPQAAFGLGFEGRRWHVSVVTEGKRASGGTNANSEDDWENQLGRTVLGKPTVDGEGVWVPNKLNVQRFWDIMAEVTDDAEAKVKGTGVWEGW